MKTTQSQGVAAVTASCVMWGLLPLFWNLLAPVNSMYILAHRLIWSMIFLGAFMLITGWGKAILTAMKDRRTMLLCLISGILITFNWGVYIYAVNSGHVLDASMGYFIEPVLVVVIGLIFFRERLRKAETVTVIMAAIGVVYLVARTGSLPLLSLLVAVSFGVYGVVKKLITVPVQVSLCIETLWMFPLAVLFALWWAHSSGGGEAALNGVSFWLLPASGLMTLIPLLIFNIGVQKVPLYLSGILTYVSPSLQFVTGLFFFHEPMNTVRLTTFLIIWAGIAITVVDKIQMMCREKKALREESVNT